MKLNKGVDLLLSLVGAFILMLPAVYNGYPLVTSDSGSYIYHAYELDMPVDRSLGYSILIRLTTFKFSLWLMIFSQSFLLAFLILRIFSKTISSKSFFLGKLFFLSAVAAFTSISWYSSQLMADIFTPIILLAAANYIVSANKKWAVGYLLIVVVSILTHNSNLLISTLFFVTLLALSFLKNSRFCTYKAKLFKLFLYSALAWVVMCSAHWCYGYGFIPSRSTHVFLVAKLSENGILKKYLEEHCSDNRYRLCDFKNQLPNHAWEFIWNEGSAFYKTGGWDSSKKEYDEIIWGTLSNPHYLFLHLK